MTIVCHLYEWWECKIKWKKKNSWGEGFNGGTIQVGNNHVNQVGTNPSGGPRGPGPPLGLNYFFFIFYSYNTCHFSSWAPLLPNKPLSHPNSNYPTQKLNKNNKNIHNGDCILAKKKKIFDIGYIVKCGSKIDKLVYWDAKR